MTTEERFQRIEGILEALAASVVARDNQIEAHTKQIGALIDLAAEHHKTTANLEKQWQAYLNTLPKN